jgi:hypothetical protein
MSFTFLYNKYELLISKSLAAVIPAFSFFILTTNDKSVLFELVLDQVIYHSFYLVFLKFGSTQLYLETSSIRGKNIFIPKNTLNALIGIGLIITISDVYWLINQDILRFGFLVYVIQLFAEYLRLSNSIHKYFFLQAPFNHAVAWVLSYLSVKQNNLLVIFLILSILFSAFIFVKFKLKHIIKINKTKEKNHKKIIFGFAHGAIGTLINWAPIAFINTFFDFSISNKITFVSRAASLINFYLLGEQSRFPALFKKKKINLINFQRSLFKKSLQSTMFFSLVISVFIFYSFDKHQLLTSLTIIIIGFSYSLFFGVEIISNLLNEYSTFLKQMTTYLILLAITSIIFYLVDENTYFFGCLYLFINAFLFLFYRRRTYIILNDKQ